MLSMTVVVEASILPVIIASRNSIARHWTKESWNWDHDIIQKQLSGKWTS